jgi:hypothetical protein
MMLGKGDLVRRIRRVATFVASVLFLLVLVVPGSASAAPDRAPSAVVGHAARPAPPVVSAERLADQQDGAALRQARRSGRTVPIPAQTSEVSTTVARPDGKLATTTYVMPVRVKRNGVWVPVSATLRRNADGTYSPAATPSGLALSGGGAGPFVTQSGPRGQRLSLTFPFRLPAPAVSGDTATYRNVLRGVDLDVTATSQGGFGYELVIKDAAAAADPALRELRLATRARGLIVATNAAGDMTASAPDGKATVIADAPQMSDSQPSRPPARLRLDAISGALVMNTDHVMLTSSSTRFPVVIAAAVSPVSSGTEGYAETKQGCPTDPTYNVAQQYGEGLGNQNYPDSTCEGLYRSYFQINTSNVNSSMDVLGAQLDLVETFGSDQNCTSDTWPMTLYWTGSVHSSTNWTAQPALQQSAPVGSVNVKSAFCGDVDVNFDVTSVMQKTAKNNYQQWSFGLFGDEANLPDSACSPGSAYNCGFMRVAPESSNASIASPRVITTFDIAPDVPANTTTTPASHNNGSTTGPGCGSNPVGWIGKTDLGAGDGSELTLNATVTSNITGEHVQAQYMLWDNSISNNRVGSNVVATPNSPMVTSGTTVSTPVGITLQDGHAYGWRVRANDGILQSAFAPDCHFNTDLTAPTVPAVTSSAFPPSGSSSSAVVGTPGSFGFSSTDPVPSGCVSTCLASGVAYYEYAFNQPLATSGNKTAAPGSTVSFTPNLWGTNILYVDAVDNAGNRSQVRQYDFYVRWVPGTQAQQGTPGDVDGDGTPDLLATSADGNLLLFKGGQDPTVSPEVAGTPASTPDGDGWNNYEITHRGSFTQSGVDDLIMHKTGGSDLYLYANNPASPGTAPQFGASTDISTLSVKPACTATANNPCTGYDSTDWSEVTQILAPGDVYGNGHPDLLTVENDQLWLYNGGGGGTMTDPVLLGSSGWSGVTLIAPGDVNGTLTLWARNNSTGAIYSWPLTLSASNVPQLGTAAGTAGPVTASSGAVVPGVTLTAAAYPTLVSSGPLAAGTCSSSNAMACPGVYAEDPQGNLWYYGGEPAASESPLSGSRVLVGFLDAPTAAWPLTQSTGTTATDVTGNGKTAALSPSGATWTYDTARTSYVLSLDGSSGYLQPPDNLVSSTTSLSLSLWFKTTTPGRVLFSTGHSVLGTSSPSGAAMPVLYIGTDGKLYGQFWNGEVDPIASPMAVDDGNWHHVVITGAGTTQSLYLNGSLVGSVGGTISNLDPLEFVGGGYVNANSWVKGPAVGWSYFDGQISNVEYYTYPLTPAEATELYGQSAQFRQGEDVTQVS